MSTRNLDSKTAKTVRTHGPFLLCTHYVLNYGKRISALSLHINRMAPLLTIGGRIAKGFDFLGYSFEPKGLSIAPKTLANLLDRIT